MITKDQANEIMLLASSCATRKTQNSVQWQMNGYCSPENTKLENDAWLKLKSLVEGLTQ